jgi:hypothetical protein
LYYLGKSEPAGLAGNPMHHTGVALHCFPDFVPGWKLYGDTPDIAALIAPGALHLNLGEKDSGTPIESARRGLQRIADAYQNAGVPANFTSKFLFGIDSKGKSGFDTFSQFR